MNNPNCGGGNARIELTCTITEEARLRRQRQLDLETLENRIDTQIQASQSRMESYRQLDEDITRRRSNIRELLH